MQFQQSCKIQDQYTKSLVFLYTSSELCENEIKGTILFIISSKHVKNLRMNLIKNLWYILSVTEYILVKKIT